MGCAFYSSTAHSHHYYQSHIYHTLKHRFSRHIDEAVLQTEHLLCITAENSFLIAAVVLFPKLYLTGDCFANFQFQFIKVLNNPTLIDEPAKPVRVLAVRIMKMVSDEVGVVCLVFLSERARIEVGNCHGIGVKFPNRNIFLFQGIVNGLFTLISAHGYFLRFYAVKGFNDSHHGSQMTNNNRSTPK